MLFRSFEGYFLSVNVVNIFPVFACLLILFVSSVFKELVFFNVGILTDV